MNCYLGMFTKGAEYMWEVEYKWLQNLVSNAVSHDE